MSGRGYWDRTSDLTPPRRARYHCAKPRLVLVGSLTLAFHKIKDFVVGVTGLEPATSTSQTLRATNCATPRTRYIISHL